MEKKKKIAKGPNLTNCSANLPDQTDSYNIGQSKIYGFEDSMSVARTLMGSIHENLLRGDLIFAYRSSSSTSKTTLSQIVVVNELQEVNKGGYVQMIPTNKFAISYISSGYSSYLPHMPIEYLDEVVRDLEEGKAEKKVIETFKYIVDDWKNRLNNGGK